MVGCNTFIQYTTRNNETNSFPLGQGSATYGTHAKLGTRKNSQWHSTLLYKVNQICEEQGFLENYLLHFVIK